MSTRSVILLFDDQSDRAGRAELLKGSSGCQVQFIDLHNKDVIAEIKAAAKTFPAANLILVDHVLDKTSPASQEMVNKGSTIVPLLREHWNACPILAITAAPDACQKDISSEAYEAIFSLDQFSRLASYVSSIIAGYAAIRKSGKNLAGLMALLRVPTDDQDALVGVLPEEVRRTLGQPECAHYMFRWFYNTFYRHPGLLYGHAWASLVLGVRGKAFEKYEKHIMRAAYTGIFRDKESPRWWKSRMYSLLLPKSARRFSVSIQQAAYERLHIDEVDFSGCYKCKEKWPEVMACVDDAALDCADMKPMHLRCTRAHKMANAKPYFEELRVMLGD